MLGKKQVSQLSVFDYVIGISMGSIASEMTINLESSYVDGVTAMVIYALIAYMISILTMKKVRLRKFFTGSPVVLIQNGKIIAEGLKKSLLDINDLLSECRIGGYFDIAEIQYAIMEPGGKISFLPKVYATNLKREDIDLKMNEPGLVANVIIDGRFIDKNIRCLGKSSEWIAREIKKQGVENVENIILATLNQDNKLVIYQKNNKIRINDVLN